MRKKFNKATITIISALLMTTLASFDMSSDSNYVVSATSLESKSKLDDCECDHPSNHEHKSKEELSQIKLEKLSQFALKFDIDPTGKSVEELKRELHQAKEQNPQKWASIKQELHQTRIEKLHEYAKLKEISIDGKTEEQIRKELNEIRCREKKQ